MKTYDYKDETKDVRGKVIFTSFEPSLKIIMARVENYYLFIIFI
jgi:hypothetical protein